MLVLVLVVVVKRVGFFVVVLSKMGVEVVAVATELSDAASAHSRSA